MRYDRIVTGTFISRPNRFIAMVDIADTVERCQFKNTGRFIIEGYKIKIISKEDRVILESDWTAVRDFIKDNPKSRYPELSYLQLIIMDAAPKYL